MTINRFMKILIIGLFLGSHFSWANPNCSKKISVAFYEFGLLYHQDEGIDRAVIDELAQRSQCQFTMATLPRAQIWLELSSGQTMLSVSAIKTPERDIFAYFSVPYIRLKNMAVLPKAIAEKYPNFNAFLASPTLRWGVVASYRHGEVQDALINQLRAQSRVDEAKDSEQLFQWLRDGQIQGAFAQPTAYNFYFRRLQFNQQAVARDWAPSDRGVEARLVFSKKHFSAAEVQQWNNLLLAMRQDGTLQRILARYLPQSELKRSLIQESTADQANSENQAK
ncbi:transporter substrate-binding domain-containing protein [Chitinibacter fontanus]|uniref:Transporter substrate-binding domain-containing protein n=1 Tax=Chitinibacter fontanus TaxID=1737446 RepID=A0A7D5VAY8_9NEIS|nr:transporter substrate-binding domain-containing protein [Chitinibacter fontanus]QLI82052.1 transporter substrate-binding domain-containing protein [Chitinibacter fontanus]